MVEIKGAVLHDAMEAVKQKFGEQILKDIISQMTPKAQKIFNGTILTSAWYPLEDFLEFARVDIKLTAKGNENELITRAENLIEKELTGIYKMFVKLGSPKFVFNRLSAIHKSYFKGVDASVEMSEDKDRAVVKYSGFDNKHRLIAPSIIGFYRKALEISGGKNVNAKVLTAIEENKGYLSIEVTWTGK
ncbi:MAG: hypothetical protein PHV06_00510 [bacterium]|nr:hypothetical protein [bacterium]